MPSWGVVAHSGTQSEGRRTRTKTECAPLTCRVEDEVVNQMFEKRTHTIYGPRLNVWRPFAVHRYCLTTTLLLPLFVCIVDQEFESQGLTLEFDVTEVCLISRQVRRRQPAAPARAACTQCACSNARCRPVTGNQRVNKKGTSKLQGEGESRAASLPSLTRLLSSQLHASESRSRLVLELFQLP